MEHQDFVNQIRNEIKQSQRVKSVASKIDGILVNFRNANGFYKKDGLYEAHLFQDEPHIDDGDIIHFKVLMQDENIVVTPSKKTFLIWNKS